jgi:hypothetical protein
MLKKQSMIGSQKSFQISSWKRMALVAAMLFSGGSLAGFVPSQMVYAHSNGPTTHRHSGHKGRSTQTRSLKLLFICKAGNGGKGGSATKKSSGAAGGSGGNCIITVPIKVFLTIQQHNEHHK